ncbi:MAG: Druantia anti-phage system protein DruA [Candidatus Scalindua sp.]
MEYITSYRGRTITTQDIATIKRIISSNPSMSRRFISQEICKVWDWRQSNGYLKDMVCRSLLLFLETRGLIKQPPRKCTPPNPLAKRKKPRKVLIDKTPLSGFIKGLFPIKLEQVRRTNKETTFNSLISEHHYLGYTQPVGEHLKYMAFSQDRPIACLAWGSSPWYIGVRDRFIGWTREIRERNLFLIANNTRFLILPWIKAPCLASYLLALNRKRLSQDWKQVYNHPLYLVETFVDTRLHIGTCYKADNWILVGKTTGRGKLSNSHKPVLSKKNERF